MHLKSKLLFLFIIISSGMLLTAVLGYLNITSMKKNIDGLYFGSFIPVTELNHILLTYHQGIQNTVINVKNGRISADEAAVTLRKDLDSINSAWQTYTGHYKREEELRYVDFTNTSIYNTNLYIERIIKACEHNLKLDRLSESTLTKTIENIQETIDKLITYEIQSAQVERKNFIQTFDNIIVQIVILFIAVFGLVLLLSYLIFESIQRQQSELELTTEKLKIANHKLQSASYTDSLTGLYNRRYFNMVYEREVKRSKREKRPVCFMMIDIDHFKQYNDTYGHLQGDSALKEVAHTLRETLQRPGDFTFRLGGEEFGVLLTDTDATNAKVVAEKLCRHVRKMKLEHKNNSASKYVTISIGSVTLTPPASMKDELLISQADRNLYEAKETGRNNAVCTTSVSDESPHHAPDVHVA